MKELAGTKALIRLILRRDRTLLPVWVLLLSALPVVVATSFAELYPTAAERQVFADTAANPALVALLGSVFDSSVGGLTAWRVSIMLVIVALISLLTVIRHTRTEEEAGRRELVGSTVVGRHAPLTAALIVTVAANLILAALLALGLILQDLPASGSVALGLAFAATGCVFAAVGAVSAQLTEGAGTARGIAISILGLAFLLRIAGDVSGEDSGLSWLSWVSPSGWAQQVRPFADERWWVFALAAGAFVVVTSAAYTLSSRRDIGAGLLAPRPGPATASPSLRSPLALAWRLHRGLLLGWTTGFAVMGIVFGSVTEAASQMMNDNPQLRLILERLGGQAGLADAYLSAVLGILGLAGSGYAIQAVLRLRSEETQMRAEPVLAAAVGRVRWAASHLLFAAVGPAIALAAAGLAAGLTYGLSTGAVREELPRVLAGAIVQLPAVWVLVGIAVALFGLLPRLAPLSWAALGTFLLLGQFGEILQLEQWMLDISPFTHLPRLPGGDVSADPLIWLVAVAALLTFAGMAGFKRRDIG